MQFDPRLKPMVNQMQETVVGIGSLRRFEKNFT